jgi:hypothetical protein
MQKALQRRSSVGVIFYDDDSDIAENGSVQRLARPTMPRRCSFYEAFRFKFEQNIPQPHRRKSEMSATHRAGGGMTYRLEHAA